MAGSVKTSSKPQSFDSFLVEKNFISKDVVRIVRREMYKQPESFENMLLSLHFMSEEMLMKALSLFCDIPFTPLENIQSVLSELPPKVFQELLERPLWFPFKKENKTLHIAVSDPLNKREISSIKNKLFPFTCFFYVASPSKIYQSLMKEKPRDGLTLSKLFTMLDESSPTLPSPCSTEFIPLILDQCLQEAVLHKASDLHLEPESKFVRLRLRIDGHLNLYQSFHKDFWDSLCVHLKVCAHMNIAETRLPQNGRFSRKINGQEIDFRISTHPTKHGESIVIRVLDRQRALLSLEEIGFPESTVCRLKQTIESKEGLFIVSGPTGSGKTTTLYSILTYLNSPTRNIMTLEQPIEYELPFARQTEINENSHFTFANGIRSILRQDPDILFIGEIRDSETAKMALRASMTGHQVYTTVHASSTLVTIQRLMDLGISFTVLAGALKGLLSQRLIRKLCVQCRKQRKITFPETCFLGLNIDSVIFEPTGCDDCTQTGYKGRIPLVEFISCTDSFNSLILKKASLSTLEIEARRTGYIPLHEQGIKYVLAGLTSISELGSVIPIEKKEYDDLSI